MPSTPIRSVYLACCALSLSLAGCASVPELGPRLELRTAQTVAAQRSLAPQPGADWPGDRWWTRFGDPQLDTLIAEGLANSPDVAAAVARVRRAAGMAQQAGAAGLPTVDVTGSAYETRSSLNNGFPDEIKQILPQGWRSGADVAASASYELDLWGKNRATRLAALSDAEAARLEAQQAGLVLSAAIASAYADLEQLYEQRDVRADALSIRTASRDLVSQRRQNGLETQGSVRSADAEVASERAALADADAQIAVRRNQIAALVGAGPDRGLTITRPRLAPDVSVPLPQGVTTELLARRPDVVAARERVEAAADRIDVARAGFYPSIRLDALIGLQALGIGNLIENDSINGRVGPAISLPIFHGGYLQGRYRVARADYDEAAATYNSTVLQSYREVADAVASRAAMADQLAYARDAVSAARDAYAVANLRYKGGLSNYLDALVVENRLLEARLALAELEARSRGLDIALVRALGGGFEYDGGAGRKDTSDE